MSSIDVEAAVRHFMKLCGQVDGGAPEKYVTDLRLRLLDEEYTELVEAINWGDKVQIAKELADLVYVTVGTAVAFDIPFNEVFGALQFSNLSKIDEDGQMQIREDGKILKGPKYVEAESTIREILGQ